MLLHAGALAGGGWIDALRDAEPSVVIALGATAALYAAGVRALWRHAGRGRGVTGRQASYFAGGVLVLALALLSPLDPLSESLFAAHMVQHMLLIAIAPPLLVGGAPLVAFAWAMPRRVRVAVHERWRGAPAIRRASGGVATLALSPWVVWIPHALAIWVWHLPGPYRLALHDPSAHALEHLSFFGTALALWWAVMRPAGVRREGYAAGILVLLVTAMQSGALGALLLFARAAWYPEQAAGAAAWGYTPLEDQQLAGLIMWIPGGFVYLIASSVLFLRWIDGGARSRRVVSPAPPLQRARGVRAAAALRLLPLLLVVLGAGCRRAQATLVDGGDPRRGRQDLIGFGCGSCHTIGGVPGAQGKVGPPLDGIGERSMIAGEAPNTPENLIRWIENPQAIEPNTAMPNLGVGPQSARDIAAYLYTLR